MNILYNIYNFVYNIFQEVDLLLNSSKLALQCALTLNINTCAFNYALYQQINFNLKKNKKTKCVHHNYYLSETKTPPIGFWTT